MKIKKRNFVVGALLSTASLAVVTSITSTFAWYSYNTKNGMAFTGIATGKTESLQVRFQGETEETDWKTSLTPDEIITNSTDNGFAGSDLAPVTQAKGFTDSSGKKCYLNPDEDYGFYGSPSYLNPKSSQDTIFSESGDYLFFLTSIEFRCVNPLKTTEAYTKGIYISFMDAKGTTTDKEDISNGLRVHISQGADTNFLLAPGYAKSGETALTGALNLIDAKPTKEVPNPVDKGIRTSDDKSEAPSVNSTWRSYIEGWDDPLARETVIYGNVTDAKEPYMGKEDTITNFVDGKISGDEKICIGETRDDGVPIPVDITIWLEGWDSTVVNRNISAAFKFGIQFEVETL